MFQHSLGAEHSCLGAMKDKAGTEITVGCRVAEASFGYGDGEVESVEVPVTGGGFNVGVKWDDPRKGGSGWSEEGGGRTAEHLLVIEAAPAIEETERPPHDFRSGSSRSSASSSASIAAPHHRRQS